MANRYILVYKDLAGNLRVAPERPTVQFHDSVTWVSNLDTNYVAGNFTPTNPPLFPQPSYAMPPGGQSTPAVVIFNNTGTGPITYSYTCSDAGITAAPAGDSVNGIIIVDPTGPGEERETKEVQRSSSKRPQEKALVGQTELNGSRR